MSSKHIFLSFKPLKQQLIKGPNKQKTNLLFLHFDILSLSIILSFIYIYIYIYIYTYIHTYFISNTNVIKVCVNWIDIRTNSHWRWNLWLKYVLESLQSFNKSQVKTHPMLSMSKLQLICHNCRTFAISIFY